jgi:hypothetical protein
MWGADGDCGNPVEWLLGFTTNMAEIVLGGLIDVMQCTIGDDCLGYWAEHIEGAQAGIWNMIPDLTSWDGDGSEIIEFIWPQDQEFETVADKINYWREQGYVQILLKVPRYIFKVAAHYKSFCEEDIDISFDSWTTMIDLHFTLETKEVVVPPGIGATPGSTTTTLSGGLDCIHIHQSGEEVPDSQIMDSDTLGMHNFDFNIGIGGFIGHLINEAADDYVQDILEAQVSEKMTDLFHQMLTRFEFDAIINDFTIEPVPVQTCDRRNSNGEISRSDQTSFWGILGNTLPKLFNNLTHFNMLKTSGVSPDITPPPPPPPQPLTKKKKPYDTLVRSGVTPEPDIRDRVVGAPRTKPKYSNKELQNMSVEELQRIKNNLKK